MCTVRKFKPISNVLLDSFCHMLKNDKGKLILQVKKLLDLGTRKFRKDGVLDLFSSLKEMEGGI